MHRSKGSTSSTAPKPRQDADKRETKIKSTSEVSQLAQSKIRDSPKESPPVFPAQPELGPVFGQAAPMQPYQLPPNSFVRTTDAPLGPIEPYIPLVDNFRKCSSPLFQTFVLSHDRIMKEGILDG
jgi:hypothetical protein